MFKFVSAGAGCGKTKFIIDSIEKISSAARVLVITYTNSCVEEINERLKSTNNKKVNVCTFHAICHKFVKSNKIFTESNSLDILGDYININITPEFENFYNYFLCHTPFNEKEYLKKLKETFPGEEFKEPLEENLSDFFTNEGCLRNKPPLHVDNKKAWMEKFIIVKDHFNALNYKYNLQYLEYFKAIEETRKLLNLYTFHHMILEVLTDISEFIMYILEEYDHIFIDEVQDLSHIQFQIVKEIAEEIVALENKTLTVVGDKHQSIFSFQGANIANFNEFISYIKKIPGLSFEEIQLQKTYRFGGEILDFVNNNFHSHESIKLEGQMTLHPLSIDNYSLISAICHIINNIPSKETILVLFQKRSNFINQLQEQVEKITGFKVQIHKKIFHQNNMLEDFFNLIEFILTRNEYYLVKWIMGGMIYISEPEFFNFCRTYKDKLWNNLIISYGELKEVECLKILINDDSCEYFFNIFLSSILYENFIHNYGKDAVVFIGEINKIISPSMNLYSLLTLKNHSLWFQQEGHIIFSTVHNAKGTEANYVLIVDGNNDKNNNYLFLKDNFPMYNFFKTAKNSDNLQEFQNLLYVAVTRAKKHLHIFGIGKRPQPNSLYTLKV
jgi:superfamily I DNA/RNA helicase